jgi:hypothetical protein
VPSTVFKPEQQVPSGFFEVLSFDTNDKQSAMLSTRVVQSTEGAGAEAWRWEAPSAQIQQETEIVQRRIKDNTFFDVILFIS